MKYVPGLHLAGTALAALFGAALTLISPANARHFIRSPRRRGRAQWEEWWARRLRGFEVDDQHVFGCLFDWQVGRFRALQDFVNVECRTSIKVVEIRAVAHQATGVYVCSPNSCECD
jgi:hypothetical protein